MRSKQRQVVDCVIVFVEDLAHHTAETQCFEEPAEVILLDLDNTMLETVDAHTRIRLLDYLLEGNAKPVAEKMLLSTRIFLVLGLRF